MSKRGAANQITQENWDKEEEEEEAGVFKLASDHVMKERKVIKPKRKLGAGGETGGETGPSGAFKGFGGFGAAKPTAGGTGLFSFGTGTTKPLSGLSNGSETKPSTGFKLTPFQTNQAQTISSGNAKEEKESEKPKANSNGVDKSDSAQRAKYLNQLKCLNEGVTKWIKEHVDKNPYCILSPIFKDYEKHLCEIEKLNPDTDKSKPSNDSAKKDEDKKEESKPATVTTSETPKPTLSSTYTFSSSAVSTGSSSSTSSGTSLFSFGASKTSSTTTGPSVFGGAAASSGATGFSFGSSSTATGMKPFSFATGTGAASSSSADNGNQETKGGDDEEYVPPKAEVSEVKEDDSLYSKRCKMYYNKEGTWIEKGVGNLHLKPCSGKTQLLIRADTNLGNILLNIMLNSQIPFSRQGKNNVTFMCIPNPPLDPKDTGDPKPTSILLRVKTGEVADELLENINKHKGE